MKRFLLSVFLLAAAISAGAAPTPHNDDSCDIAVLPAATLLLPYFEVDVDDPNGETTLFTLTNVTNVEQIAHVTLWTDRAYPVINFNVYLTGYDVQSINLFDVIVRGIIAPPNGTGTDLQKRGRFSDPNPSVSVSFCDRLPGVLDPLYVEYMQEAFITGDVPALGTIAGCDDIGEQHDNAIGYATIDVVGTCDVASAVDERYWRDIIRFDNVLTGDYQQLNRGAGSAQGGPLVHIRAVPEGGTPAARRSDRVRYDPEFQRTFYARYVPADSPRLDGRQPLPSQFAARWIQGSASDFQTRFKIWREGRTAATRLPCSAYAQGAAVEVTDVVVFDENENAVGLAGADVELPSTSVTSVADPEIYPQLSNGASSGWMYLNVDRDWRDEHASQSWIVSSMRALGRFSVDMDAAALGNGCTPDQRPSEVSRANGGIPIAPARDENPGSGAASTDNDDSCDLALLPAATLLLPYFEVDLDDRLGETTLFTITNVSPKEQIARVTLWTDYSVPVLTFNVYLTGYDVQSINLYDVIGRGVIGSAAGTGTRVSPTGPYSDRNTALSPGECRRLPGELSFETIERMQDAFVLGIIGDVGDTDRCDDVGFVHDNAVGYATIDVVRNCASNGPMTAEYWTNDIAYDNVLVGDYQQVNLLQSSAQGAPMVHIRAVPEGGTAAERATDEFYQTRFPRTFYSRYQAQSTPKLDGRQPLPSTFAPRWIAGGVTGFQTSMKIWREGKAITRTCGQHDEQNVTKVMEVVTFDEAENAVGDIPVSRVCTPIITENTLPSTSRTDVRDTSVYPQLANGALAGWMYLNLDNCECDAFASQNWVTYSMRAEGRFSTDIEAAALGNGCSPAVGESEVTTGTAIIGPAPNRR